MFMGSENQPSAATSDIESKDLFPDGEDNLSIDENVQSLEEEFPTTLEEDGAVPPIDNTELPSTSNAPSSSFFSTDLTSTPVKLPDPQNVLNLLTSHTSPNQPFPFQVSSPPIHSSDEPTPENEMTSEDIGEPHSSLHLPDETSSIHLESDITPLMPTPSHSTNNPELTQNNEPSQATDENSREKPTPSQRPATSSSNSNFECNICLDEVSEPVVTLCGHLFCWECLHSCLERGISECPVCKSSITESNIIPLYGRGQDSTTRKPLTSVKRPPAQRTEPPAISRSTNIITGAWSFSFEFFGLGSAFDTNPDLITNRTYPIYHRLQARTADRQPDIQFQHIPILFLVIGLSIAFYLLTV